jgi:hypothetical protein
MDVLIPIIAIISLFLGPITGVRLILVSRLALKPMVETLSEALRASRPEYGAEHMQALMDQVEDLTAEVRRLQSIQDFDRQLLGSSAEPGAAQD